MSKTKPATIAEYISSAPKEAQKNLRELYAILRKAAPRATEGIKWRSPVFEEKRILFAFAAFKFHLNFMPTPSAMKPFKKRATVTALSPEEVHVRREGTYIFVSSGYLNSQLLFVPCPKCPASGLVPGSKAPLREIAPRVYERSAAQ